MDKSEAYKIVFDDLMQINLCKGIYDAQYRHKDFMHGEIKICHEQHKYVI